MSAIDTRRTSRMRRTHTGLRWVRNHQREIPKREFDDVATHLFLGRIAPLLKPRQPALLLESLLNQLPQDVRRVIVRMNGLDGQAIEGLREVASDFKMSQGQVRALMAAGEQGLADAVCRLTHQQNEKR